MNSDYGTALVIIGFVLFACLMFFLAIRELVTWYLKIDRMVQNQYETNRLLSEILKEYRGEPVNSK